MTRFVGSACWFMFCTVNHKSRTNRRCNGFSKRFARLPPSLWDWCSKLDATVERCTPTSSPKCPRKAPSARGCNSTRLRRAIPRNFPSPHQRLPGRVRHPLRNCPPGNLSTFPAQSLNYSGTSIPLRSQTRPIPQAKNRNRFLRLGQPSPQSTGLRYPPPLPGTNRLPAYRTPRKQSPASALETPFFRTLPEIVFRPSRILRP